jgi:hypothetical protein
MRLLLSLVLFSLCIVPATAQDGTRRFGDWAVACGDDGYCAASTFVPATAGSGADASYGFRIGRHAQETYWELSLTFIGSAAEPVMPFTFLVDGKGETLSGPSEIAPFGSANDLFLLGSKAQSLMDQLMPGHLLDVTFTDASSATAKASFSLDGLTAALIWIDETQGRLGSERVAEAPPIGLEPITEAPEPKPAVDLRTVELVNLHNSGNCSVRIDAESAGRISMATLDPFHTLYVVPCEDFAYNFIRALYVASDDAVSAVALPESDAAMGDQTNLAYSPGWNEATEELSTYYKGGNGNCGSEGRWNWSLGQFNLIELRARETCGQSDEEWPIVAGGS